MPAGDRDGGDSPQSHPPADPRRIRSLAVTTDDVVDAFEASVRGGRETVLRVTPPFSGRMRARLHAADVVDPASPSGDGVARSGAASDDPTEGASEGAPIHLPPERFIANAPPYPTVDDTEDALRDSETTYTRGRHRKRHQRAVEAWRAAVRERLVETVSLETAAGSHEVSVAYLG